MKGTIFEELSYQYEIRLPGKKLPYPNFFPSIELLAKSFYQNYYKYDLKTNPKHSFLTQTQCIADDFKTLYDEVFYSLGRNQERIMNFVAFVICLLAEQIFIETDYFSSASFEKLHKQLEQNSLKIREHMYIVFINKSLGQKVGRKNAVNLFKLFLNPTQQKRVSGIRQNLQLQSQMKKVKENLENPSLSIRIKSKKFIKINDEDSLRQYKAILDQNYVELVQQKRNKKQVKKCLTEQNKKISKRSLKNQIFSSLSKYHSNRRIKTNDDEIFNVKYWNDMIYKLKNFSNIEGINHIESFGEQKINSSLCQSHFQKITPHYLQKPIKRHPSSFLPLISKREGNRLKNRSIDMLCKNDQISPSPSNKKSKYEITANLYRNSSKLLKKHLDQFENTERCKVLVDDD